MTRLNPTTPASHKPRLTPAQVEAIARQLPGIHARELMRLQQADPTPTTRPAR